MPRQTVAVKFANPEAKRLMVKFLMDRFTPTVGSRTNQIDGKYRRWQDNYNAKPFQAVRTVPFYRASNFVPQLIRMHTDILAARIFGFLKAPKPFWKVAGKRMDLPTEALQTMSEWMDIKCFFDLRFDELLDQSILSSLKNGTLVIKWPWVQRSYFDVSSEQDEKEIKFGGLEPRPIPFDDHWVYPITAQQPYDVRVHFHRIRLTKEEIEERRDTSYWLKDAAEKLLKQADNAPSTSQETQATSAGISLSQDVAHPFSAIEAQFDYRMNGRNYKMMVTFNPYATDENSILRAVYNPSSMGLNQYTRICPIPRENFYYGYAIPEILEMYQEEQAQIHNSRRDASVIGNTPTFKVKNGADIPNPAAEWYPGKTFKLDDMGDMELVFAQTSYNHMIEEERQVMSLAEQATGVTPPMQGAGAGMLTGKRGIYNTGGTLALLAEGNRRLDVYVRRMRYPMHEIGSVIYYSHKDYADLTAEFQYWSEEKRAHLQQMFSIDPSAGRGGPLFFEIGASDASSNRETDRTSLLLMSNTMAAYYRQIVEAAGMVSQVPEGHPIRALLLAVLDGARDLSERLLFAFDVGDRRRILPDAVKILGGGTPGPGQAGAPQREGMPGSPEVGVVPGVDAISELLTQIKGQNPSGPGNSGGPRPV